MQFSCLNSGQIYILSERTKIDQHDCVALLPSGILATFTLQSNSVTYSVEVKKFNCIEVDTLQCIAVDTLHTHAQYSISILTVSQCVIL